MGKHAWKWIGMLSFVALIFSTVLGPVNVWARKKENALEKQMQGNWTLVSLVNEQDGKKTEPFGPNPRGSLVFTPDGHFSVIVLNASLPKFASSNRMKGTPEENQVIIQGSIAYFGSYKVADVKENMVIMHIEKGTYPNWDGVDHKRTFTFNGDEMKVFDPTTSIGGGTNYGVWKRVK
jgi:hypothetical protein